MALLLLRTFQFFVTKSKFVIYFSTLTCACAVWARVHSLVLWMSSSTPRAPRRCFSFRFRCFYIRDRWCKHGLQRRIENLHRRLFLYQRPNEPRDPGVWASRRKFILASFRFFRFSLQIRSCVREITNQSIAFLEKVSAEKLKFKFEFAFMWK